MFQESIEYGALATVIHCVTFLQHSSHGWSKGALNLTKAQSCWAIKTKAIANMMATGLIILKQKKGVIIINLQGWSSRKNFIANLNKFELSHLGVEEHKWSWNL